MKRRKQTDEKETYTHTDIEKKLCAHIVEIKFNEKIKFTIITHKHINNREKQQQQKATKNVLRNKLYMK